MIKNYKDFLLEGINFESVKDKEFWEDYNQLLKKLYNDSNFYPFWEFLEKYENSYLKNLDKEKAYNKLFVYMTNYNRIPKRISFGEYIYMWAHSIRDIKEYHLKNNLPPIDEPIYWLKNEKIKVYRGINSDSDENIEYLEKNDYKSFTLDIEMASRFTQPDWQMGGWVDKEQREGVIIEAEIIPKNIHLYNPEGGEYECVLKGHLKYNTYHYVDRGEIIKTT